MKTIYLLIFVGLFAQEIKAQTTLKYSGTGTTSYAGSTIKVATVVENLNTVSPISTHVGLLSTATNGGAANYGIIGTTRASAGAPLTANTYIGVFGDNSSNGLAVNNASVAGGVFNGQNTGSGSYSYGAICNAGGVFPKTVETIGLDAGSSNPLNTFNNSVIAVRGITTSGQSTVSTIYKDIANPGGFFSSNNGQGVYATTSGTYKSGTSAVSQAVTGYSNVTNAFNNVGVVGFAEGTGAFKTGVYGVADGTAASLLSSGITGEDKVNSNNSYAGYFIGKVLVDGGLSSTSLSGTGTRDVKVDANGNLTASSVTKYYSAPYTSFVKSISSDGNTANYILGIAYLGSGSTVPLTCPLYLPHGAKQVNLRVYYSDSDATNDLVFTSSFFVVATGSTSGITSFTSSGSNSGILFADIALSNSVVDNQNNVYSISVSPKSGSTWNGLSTSLGIRNVVITYTE